MAYFTPERLEEILAAARVQLPPGTEVTTFVETGTYQGDTVLMVWRTGRFADVRTIELSPGLHRRASERLRETGILCYQGSSRVILRQLARELDRSALFYLDAHWFSVSYGAHPEVSAEDAFPLWAELDVLKERPYPDIIVVDDVHTFGRKDAHTDPRWQGVSPETIVGRVGGHRIRCVMRVGDQLVLYRQPTSAGTLSSGATAVGGQPDVGEE